MCKACRLHAATAPAVVSFPVCGGQAQPVSMCPQEMTMKGTHAF